MGNVKEWYKVAQKNSVNSTGKVLVHDCFVSRTVESGLLQGSTNATDNNETLIINQMWGWGLNVYYKRFKN